MLYHILVFLSDICCLLPASVARFIGKILGELTWIVVPKKRKQMAIHNIERCLKVSTDKAEQIAKKSWTRFGPMIMEVLRFKVICKNIDKYVTIKGEENIKKAMSYGNGGVIATAHSGNWEIIGAALTHKGMKIAGVAQHQRNEGVNNFINYCRAFTGMHITDKLDIKEMMKMLGQKYFIMSASANASFASGFGYSTVGKSPSGSSCSGTTYTFSNPISLRILLTGMLPVP